MGWTGDFSDWNSAFAAGTGLVGWTGSALSGGALAWSNAEGDSQASPPEKPVDLTVGPAGYNGLVFAIPEPSKFALAGLGAVMLMVFHRRR